MKDEIIRGIAAGNQVRFFAVNCTEALKELQQIHNLSITTSVLMGRMAAAGLLLGFTMKSERDTVTVKINSSGAVKHVIITSNNRGEVKGYIDEPEVELPLKEDSRINVGGLFEDGILTVVKDMAEKAPYSGQVQLQTGEIASDLAYYFVQSEQTPTATGLGVLIEEEGNIKQAGGFMLQLLPETKEDVIEKLEQNLSSFPNLTDVMDMGYTMDKIVSEMLLKGLEPKILARHDVKHRCDCSEEKFELGLELLEPAELQEYYDKNEDIVVICHFCNTRYSFGREVISRYLEKS